MKQKKTKQPAMTMVQVNYRLEQLNTDIADICQRADQEQDTLIVAGYWRQISKLAGDVADTMTRAAVVPKDLMRVRVLEKHWRGVSKNARETATALEQRAGGE